MKMPKLASNSDDENVEIMTTWPRTIGFGYSFHADCDDSPVFLAWRSNVMFAL